MHVAVRRYEGDLLAIIGKDGFKLTMGKYYTPKDINIDKVGIPPEKEVKDRELTEEEKASYKKLIEEYRIGVTKSRATIFFRSLRPERTWSFHLILQRRR